MMSRSVSTKPHRAHPYRRQLLCALILLSVSGITAWTQADASNETGQAGGADKQTTAEPPARTTTSEARKESDKNTGEKTNASPSRASDKPFKPTEKISEDFSVPFPVDI